MVDRDQQIAGIGMIFAFFGIGWNLIQSGGWATLTSEGGFLLVTTVAGIIFSFGKMVPANFKKYVAAVVLILGAIIFLNLVMGIHLFGLQLVY